jgi:hypothetical protein
MRNYILLVLSLVIFSPLCFSQAYKAQAALPPVDRDGFYRVLLTPDISVHASEGFSNVRIFSDKGQEVPYLLETNSGSKVTDTFNEYIIEQKLQIEDSCTIIILSNNSDNPIHNISLLIRNAETTKEVTLSGSDDRQKWYALKEKFFLSNMNNTSGTSELKIVDFPLSSYRYYKLLINDKKSAPLNIIKAGHYVYTQSEGPSYFSVPGSKITQADSIKEKRTYVKISFDTLHLLDRIIWNISGSPFYLRNATLFSVINRIDKKGRPEKFQDYISSFQLSSKSENVLYLPGIKVDNLVLVIENDDNPPLKNVDPSFYQLSRHVNVWLEKESAYVMKFGDASFNTPVYDIAFFKDSIPTDVPAIQAAPVSIIETQHEARSTTFFTSSLFIWSAIVVVIVLLGFMSVRLLREAGAPDSKFKI